MSLLAWPTMKLSGLSYAVATLAFAEMARIALLGWHWQVERDGTAVGPAGGEGLRDIRWRFESEVSPAAFLALLFDIGLLDAARIFERWRMVVFGGVVALFLRWRPRGLLDEALVHRMAERRRVAALPATLEAAR